MNRDCASRLCQDALFEAGLVMGSVSDSHAGLTHGCCMVSGTYTSSIFSCNMFGSTRQFES